MRVPAVLLVLGVFSAGCATDRSDGGTDNRTLAWYSLTAASQKAETVTPAAMQCRFPGTLLLAQDLGYSVTGKRRFSVAGEIVNIPVSALGDAFVGALPDLLRERQHHLDLWKWCERMGFTPPAEFSPSDPVDTRPRGAPSHENSRGATPTADYRAGEVVWTRGTVDADTLPGVSTVIVRLIGPAGAPISIPLDRNGPIRRNTPSTPATSAPIEPSNEK